jgi:uncharacterized protein YceK
MLIFIIVAVLLSGCIGTSNKYGNKAGSNGDEYGTDNSMEEDDSGIIQANYNSLDLNNKGSKVSNVQSVIYTNTTGTVDNAAAKTSLDAIKR